MEIFKNFVDRVFLPVRKFKAETVGKALDVRRGSRIFMNPDVLLIPLDQLESGNEDKVFFQSDALRRLVLRRHVGRVMNIEITLRERAESVFFDDLFGNHAVDSDFLKCRLHRFADDFLRQGAFQGIDGHDSFQTVIFIERLKRGIDQGHLSVFVLNAAVKEIFARFEPVPHIRLIEPHHRERQSVLITVRLDGL